MPKLVLSLGDQVVKEYVLGNRPVLAIGRMPKNDVVIEDLTVSREHARLECRTSKYMLTDLGSKNGTFVNKVRVPSQSLQHGDVVKIGRHRIAFMLTDEELLPRTELETAAEGIGQA